MATRLEVRLDPEHRLRLEEIAREKGAPISEVVRELIDDAYEQLDRSRRLKAAESLASYAVDVPEDPQELSRILSDAHKPRIVY